MFIALSRGSGICCSWWKQVVSTAHPLLLHPVEKELAGHVGPNVNRIDTELTQSKFTKWVAPWQDMTRMLITGFRVYIFFSGHNNLQKLPASGAPSAQLWESKRNWPDAKVVAFFAVNQAMFTLTEISSYYLAFLTLFWNPRLPVCRNL